MFESGFPDFTRVWEAHRKATFGPFIEEFEAKRKAFEEAARRISQIFLQGPKVFAEVQPYLLESGWYPSFEQTLHSVRLISQWIREGNHDAIENEMVDFARSRVSEAEVSLGQRWPQRQAILADAFEAHRAGKFTLSVPAMLAQADGIGCEILRIDKQFFSDRSKLGLGKALGASGPPETDLVAGDLEQLMLEAIWSGTSLGVRTRDRDERRQTDPHFGPLNRHGVMHGLDTDYHTEANSLRAVLLLDYLAWLDSMLQKHESSKKDSAEQTGN
jgi:hypothetical protein